ncbi:F-box protein pof12 [Penicillium subrubescens]|uniref:F-box protein pof12 n=1 Tax=Penicillium subrubescens TaxID=1316194 RepID=A0A1Q5TUG0_9EURO|nr:F-box protein pof12 [Penicillium subrubescens]
MSKRRRDDIQLDLPPTKRLSHRFHTLAGDSELWKRQYYSQWVRPRARRLANVTRSSLPPRVEYTPKVSTWFDHSHLAEEGKATNWKGQYRLRHNWSTGVCRVTEVEFPRPPAPPVLVKLCAGVVFTADQAHGLRAWCAKDPAYCLASIPFPKEIDETAVCPTALAVSQLDDEQEIVVGFDDGHFNRYVFDMETSRLYLQSSHIGFKDGAITAVALSSPYLLIVSQHKSLSLYNLRVSSHVSGNIDESKNLRKLASLNAANMVAPMTLSLRTSGLEIVATIVYSFYHIGCGWSLGIQELRFNPDGEQVESRLASTVDSQYGTTQPRGRTSSRIRRHSTGTDASDGHITAAPVAPSIMHPHPPTSMSYSHPYLLTSHADNTLTMYLLVSDSRRLYVRGGQRLWGHTSSVSAVQVTNRGKAVSVSSRGDEIRIWELEPAVRSLGSRQLLQEDNSIQVNPENKDRDESEFDSAPQSLRGDMSDSGLDGALDDVSVMHGCVGFDEERVLLLREKTVGTQLLECYDFT